VMDSLGPRVENSCHFGTRYNSTLWLKHFIAIEKLYYATVDKLFLFGSYTCCTAWQQSVVHASKHAGLTAMHCCKQTMDANYCQSSCSDSRKR